MGGAVPLFTVRLQHLFRTRSVCTFCYTARPLVLI